MYTYGMVIAKNYIYDDDVNEQRTILNFDLNLTVIQIKVFELKYIRGGIKT